MNIELLLTLLTRALALGAQYNNLIGDIRANHPDVWERVRTSYGSALAEFETSTVRSFGREQAKQPAQDGGA